MAPRPSYLEPVCECGATLNACYRESASDGDCSGHDRRMEALGEWDTGDLDEVMSGFLDETEADRVGDPGYSFGPPN